ncbi:MAG: HPr(Ser) kinase/phosphatase, partial [Verrucomicrobia bacterium]|nr:HPr(Ser) kinase/phosphatase [Verrucomicrobiota bacterium]
MPPNKQITVADFFEAAREELQMTLIDGERHLRRVIREPTVNRPGLALAGCVRFFAWRRVQVFGSAEVYYLHSLSPAEREARARRLFEFRIPCAVFCRNLRPEPYFKELALRAGAPLFRS